MSKRRDWDRVGREEKVRQQGSLPVAKPDCLAEPKELSVDGPPAHLEDKERLSETVLQKCHFNCMGYYISLHDDLQQFARRNRLDARDPKIQTLFIQVKFNFERDLEKLKSHIDLVATWEDVSSAIKSLERTLGRHLTFRL
jgi:hypothetical protein